MARLRQAGLENYDQVIDRKKRIDAFFLTKKDYESADLKKDYYALLLMPEKSNTVKSVSEDEGRAHRFYYTT